MEDLAELNILYSYFPMSTSLLSSSPISAKNPNFTSNFTPIFSNNNDCPATQPRYPFRYGIPPIPPPSPSSNINGNAFHYRSSSQPHSFVSEALSQLNSPTVPSPNGLPTKEDRTRRIPSPLPLTVPRASHRRSHSDVPFGTTGAIPPIPRPRSQSAKWELRTERQAENNGFIGDEFVVDKNSGENGDDFVLSCMNFDSLEALNSCETVERHEDLESSRMSGTRNDSSENEAESSVKESYGVGSKQRREGSNKRTAPNDLPSVNPRHFRSLSMDSLHFGSESPTLSPSPTNSQGQLSPGDVLDGCGDVSSVEFGNVEFTSAEVKKIMMNQKLAEMAQVDPKKVKRILANRQSAAKSKERKMRYINELEHKVQTLQIEATNLSAQLTVLQRDSTGLSSENNELKVRLQAMEQEAQLKEALNMALVAEVQRLKSANGEIIESKLTKSI